MLVEPARVDLAGREVGMRQHVAQEGDVGADALQAEFAQRARGARHGIGEVARRRVGDDLGQQRVEGVRGAIAGVAEAVGAHARPVGRLVGGERAAARPHRAVGCDGLHVDARLDRVAARRQRLGAVEAELLQGLSLRQADLRLHQVDACHRLGDGVLALQAGIGLDEGEGLRAGAARDVDQELEGAEVEVADAPGQPHGGVDDLAAQALVEVRRGRDLDDLLEAALHAALALAQRGDGAGAIAEDLHLDVARTRDQLLDIELVAAEGGARLGAAALEGGLDLLGAQHHAGAAPPPPASALMIMALPDPSDAKKAFASSSVVVIETADDGHVGGRRSLPRASLVAEQPEVPPGPTKVRPALAQALAKSPRRRGSRSGCTASQPAFFRRRDHRVDVEIAAAPRPGSALPSSVTRRCRLLASSSE